VSDLVPILRRALLGAAVWLVVFVVAPTPSRSGEQVTVTHWGVLMYGAPYAVAIEKGYYKEQGLDIDGVLTSKGGGTTVRNVMASSLPYGEVSLAAVVAAINQGLKLKIVHTGVRTAGEILWVVNPDSAITSVKDLAGQKVAITSPKSVTEMLLILVSDKNGIKPERIAAGGIGAGLTMLEQKGVVAAPVMDPVWAKVQNKFKPLFFVKDELPPVVQTVGVTTEEYAAANPEKLRKLIAARRKGVAFIAQNPEETARIVAKMYNLEEDVALTSIKNLQAIHYWSDGAFEYEGMNSMIHGLQVIGEASGPVDWKAHVDESFLK
jgi:NitT/TauT family transport system substrate-binding protein